MNIVILSFSFLCTKIEKRFHNPVHGHRLISNTVQISLLLVGRLPQRLFCRKQKGGIIPNVFDVLNMPYRSVSLKE